MFFGPCVAAYPVEIANRLGAAGDDKIFRRGCADKGQIALNSSTLIKHACINGVADWHIHIVATKSLQDRHDIATFENIFREAGLIENRHCLASGAVLSGMTMEPVL